MSANCCFDICSKYIFFGKCCGRNTVTRSLVPILKKKKKSMTSHFRLVYYNIVMCLTVTFQLSCVNTVKVLTTLPNMSFVVCLLHAFVYLCKF